MRNKYVFAIILAFAFYNHTAAQLNSLVWARSFGGPAGGAAYAVTADAAGNVYTIGGFQNFVDLDPGPGVYTLTSTAGVYVSKLDASGNFVWGKCLGSPNCYEGHGIAVDPEGNVYVTGQFQGLSDFDPGPGVFNLNGLFDVFIAKLDPLGNFVWAKSIGSNDNENAYSIAVDKSSNVYVTGYFGNTVDFDPGPGVYNLSSNLYFGDVFILKLNSVGNFVWAKSMESTTSADIGLAITLDDAGNVYTTGYFYGPADFDPGAGVYTLNSGGGLAAFISKLDGAGNFVWAKSFGGTGLTWGTGIKVDAGGNIFTTGMFQLTADFDPSAGVYNLTAIGDMDIFINKLDASGNLIWVKNIGGTGCNNRPNSIALDKMSNVYTTGIFNATTDFDPGISTYTVATTGLDDWDIFISELDSSGNFVWAGNIGADSTYEVGQGITTDTLGNVYVCGYFIDTCDVNPGAGNYPLISYDNNDAFIIKLNNGLLAGVNETKAQINKLVIYPNPNNGTFTVQYNDGLKQFDLILIDQLGQELHSLKINPGLNTIQTGNLAKGMYYYSVLENKAQIESGKIIIE